MQIEVKNGNITQAYRILMKALTKDGLFKELRRREFYEPPAKKKLRKHTMALSRIRKEARKRKEIFENLESKLSYRAKYTKVK